MDVGEIVKLARSISDPDIKMEAFVGALCVMNPGNKFKDDLSMWFIENSRPHFMTDLLFKTQAELAEIKVSQYLDAPCVIRIEVMPTMSFTMSKGGSA